MWSSFGSITNCDVASGFVVQAADTVKTVPVFDAIVRTWPAPRPETIRTCDEAHLLVVYAVPVAVSVVPVEDATARAATSGTLR